MKNKGLVKIMETIIASIIIISSMSYFVLFYFGKPQWSYAFLESYGKDTLSALDKSGYMKYFMLQGNFTEEGGGLLHYIKTMLPRNIIFSFELEGTPRPNIRIGCACEADDYQRIKSILSLSDTGRANLSFNGRRINISVRSDTIDRLFFAEDLDIIILPFQVLLSAYSYEINNFLRNGKSIIYFTDINQTFSDSYMEELFNITWVSGNPGSANVFDISSPGKVSREISNYFILTPVRINAPGSFYLNGVSYQLATFYNVTTMRWYVNYSSGLYGVNDIFIAGGWSIKVVEIASNGNYADISIINRTYTFELPNAIGFNNISKGQATVISNSIYSSCQARDEVALNGQGRVVWMKNYSESYTDINQLFKSLLLWMASENYNLEKNLGIKKYIPDYYTKISYIIPGNIDSEPYEAKLILWYAY